MGRGHWNDRQYGFDGWTNGGLDPAVVGLRHSERNDAAGKEGQHRDRQGRFAEAEHVCDNAGDQGAEQRVLDGRRGGLVREQAPSERQPRLHASSPPAATEPTSSFVSDIAGDYVIDPSHTRLGFSARHAMVTKVRGQFHEFSGTAHVDAENPAASKVDLTITAASVSTGSPDRDGHLQSNDFFGAEENPNRTGGSSGARPPRSTPRKMPSTKMIRLVRRTP